MDTSNGRALRAEDRSPVLVTGTREPGTGHQHVGDLVRQLSSDASLLVRQEITLAKAELKESATNAARGATKVGIAIAVAIPGLLALGAFVIIALGDLLNENYWLSALIVALAMLAAAAILAKRGVRDFSNASLVPDETVGTLREDVQWAKEETQAFKRAFTAPHPHPQPRSS